MPLHLGSPRIPFFTVPNNRHRSPILDGLFPTVTPGAKCCHLQGSFWETRGEIPSAGDWIQGTAYNGLKRAGRVKGEDEAA